MINTLFWGFDENAHINAISTLETSKEIFVVKHFGDKKQFDFNLRRLLEDPSFMDSELSSVSYHHEAFDTFLLEFLDIYSRTGISEAKSFHELKNIFYRYCYYFSTILLDNNVKLVMFKNCPHFGMDNLLYRLAKLYNIEVIITYQSLVPNRFFFTNDLDNFGVFKHNYYKKTDLSIDFKFEKNLFYMNTIKKEKALKCIRKFSNNIKKILLGKTLKRGISVAGTIQNFIECKRYQKLSQKHSTTNINLDINFIYFPLQLQPELTTSVFGGKYADQLLAIEHLSQSIPEDWYIYVKENPKQKHFQRGEYFFKRLLNIKNILYVDKSINTYTLMEKCKFVSTVTGTAGWESITGGKATLIFGNAWYKSLPGVFSFSKDFDLNELLNCKIDQNQLEYEYNKLLSTSAVGLIDYAYKNIIENYSEQKNEEHMVSFIRYILNSLKIEK